MSQENISIIKNYDSSKISWLKSGGPISQFIKIKNLDDLKKNTQITSNQNIISIGNFSNLLIKDKGFDGIAIKLGGDFAKIKIENDIILVGSAVLDNYFSKRPTPLKPQWFRPHQSNFANTIYTELQKVKFGTQITYGELAVKAGYSSQYARAVGQAMNKNPWPLFVPCHRVIGNNGELGGFAPGLDIKKALLPQPTPHSIIAPSKF